MIRAGAAALALALLASGAARADVWGYVDAQGVAHFAAERLDERYELYFRQGQSFDTAEGLPVPGAPRPVAVPTQAPRLIAFFEVSPAYKGVKHHLREASAAHGVDYELLKAVIATESGFDPRAVSPKGAVGLMQVMPATAGRWGVVGDAMAPVEAKLTDPRTNIRTGTRHLRHLLDLFPGQLELALAAYNAGEGAVQRAGNRIPNYRETQNYVKTVLQLYTMLKPPNLQRVAAVPGRVRLALPGLPADAADALQPAGGAYNRGNLPPVAHGSVPARPSQPAQPSRPSAPSQPAAVLGAGPLAAAD